MWEGLASTVAMLVERKGWLGHMWGHWVSTEEMMESTEGLLAGPLEGLPTEPQLNTQDADALDSQWLSGTTQKYGCQRLYPTLKCLKNSFCPKGNHRHRSSWPNPGQCHSRPESSAAIARTGRPRLGLLLRGRRPRRRRRAALRRGTDPRPPPRPTTSCCRSRTARPPSGRIGNRSC